MARKKTNSKAPPGTRPLRVGEEIRHAVSSILMRGEIHNFESYGVPVTVTEVRVSPDLRHANIYVMPLGGQRKDDIIYNLRNADVLREFRMALADAVELQYVPQLRFELDESFEAADKIERLIKQARARDDQGDN